MILSALQAVLPTAPRGALRTRWPSVLCLALILLLTSCSPSSLDGSNAGSARGGSTRGGDPRAGLSLYKAEGCASCHALGGVSVGEAGPALNGEARRGLPWLRAMLGPHARNEKAPPLSPSDSRDLAAFLATR